jgi:hypothetical protein
MVLKKRRKNLCGGGGLYRCFTKIYGTNHTFSVEKYQNIYKIHLYYEPHNNINESFNLKRIKEQKQLNVEPLKASILFSKRVRGVMKKFLNDPENMHDLIFIYKEGESMRSISEGLTLLVECLPHLSSDHSLRINDTLVNDDKTNVDDDGYRIPYPSDKELVNQIISMINQ